MAEGAAGGAREQYRERLAGGLSWPGQIMWGFACQSKELGPSPGGTGEPERLSGSAVAWLDPRSLKQPREGE